MKSQAFNQIKGSLEAEMPETRPEFFAGSGDCGRIEDPMILLDRSTGVLTGRQSGDDHRWSYS